MTCQYCNDTGIMHLPDGPDDFTEDFCGCKKGGEAEAQEAITEAERRADAWAMCVHND